MESLKVLNQSEVNDLYEVFEHLSSVLNKYSIKWCCSGGTLLGAVRNNGLILYDDDIDITIDRQDVETLFWLSQIVERRGKYKLKRIGKYIKLYYNTIFIDIFILDGNEYPQRHWKSYNFHDDELHPCKISNFGLIQVNIPNKWEEYLNRTMPDWDKYAVIYNHRTKGKKKISFNDQPELLKPYLPEV